MLLRELLIENQIVNPDVLYGFVNKVVARVERDDRRQWLFRAAVRYITNNPENEEFLFYIRYGGARNDRDPEQTKREVLRYATSSAKPHLDAIVAGPSAIVGFQDIEADDFDHPDAEDACDKLEREIIDIADWLNAAPEEYQGYLKMGYQQARQKAEAYKLKLSRAEQPGDTQVVLELPHGWRWVWLKTPRAVTDEGRRMKNCLKDKGWYTRALSNTMTPESFNVLSLRDPHNRPHLTATYGPYGLDDILGPTNIPPKPIYMPAVKALADHFGANFEQVLETIRRRHPDAVIFDS